MVKNFNQHKKYPKLGSYEGGAWGEKKHTATRGMRNGGTHEGRIGEDNERLTASKYVQPSSADEPRLESKKDLEAPTHLLGK